MNCISALLLVASICLGVLSGPPTLIAQSSTEPGDQLPLIPTRNLRFNTNQATWASLDVSPDGKTILFELLGDLYEMPINGGDAHCIACGMPFDSQPVYAPDGKSIAFVSDRSGNENLWIANADGSAPRQLSNLDDNTVFISPAWSQDGKSIYISRFKPDINAFELWRYTTDNSINSQPEQITHAKSTPGHSKGISRQRAWRSVVSRRPLSLLRSQDRARLR